MTISREIIDRTLALPLGRAGYFVIEKLHDAGHEAYWVGGSVRDMLMGKMPTEIDVATSATPAHVEPLFRAADMTHASLGAVTVHEAGFDVEITTFRRDSEQSDGRRPEKITPADLATDAERRDATINALYWSPMTSVLHDFFTGLQDAHERLVRFIGDPATRIQEDALRMLRMIRLRATIDGQYHPETYAAIASSAHRTTTLSGTRVLEELEKMLRCPHPDLALRDLADMGVLKASLPEIAACRGVAQPSIYHHEGDVFNHLVLCTTKFTEDHEADVRLAALLHDIGKPQTFSLSDRIHFDHHAEVSSDIATTLLKRLGADGTRVKKIAWLIRHHMMMSAFSELSVERKAHWYFHPWFKELLQLLYLDAAGTMPQDLSLYESIVKDYDEFLNARPRPERPLLSGNDIMEILGIGPGESVGKASKALYEAQVKKLVTSKKQAREFLKAMRPQL